MTRSYVTENNIQRARLSALVDRLSDAELARPLAAGWTVGAVLAHVAFWDQRVLTLIERWEPEGPGSTPRRAPARTPRRDRVGARREPSRLEASRESSIGFAAPRSVAAEQSPWGNRGEEQVLQPPACRKPLDTAPL